MVKQTWARTTFSGIRNSLKGSEVIQYHFKKLSYLPAIMIYGLSIIALLKVSQVILDWSF